MPFLRFLLALACVSLIVSGLMLQNGPHDIVVDVCPRLHQLALACPGWMSPQRVPDFTPFALYALAGLGILIVISPLLRGALDQPPATALEQFIQRGRDLHERCRKEGDQLVQPDIDAWTAEVTAFLRRLGHRYVLAFGDFRDIQLFASQYDTAATIEIRQRLHRLNEFLQRFHDDGVPSA
jgi:hypothetical protein